LLLNCHPASCLDLNSFQLAGVTQRSQKRTERDIHTLNMSRQGLFIIDRTQKIVFSVEKEGRCLVQQHS
ncbi:MAG: hypothetical protein Q7T20_18135, partial [Saprospiraceae bacterium]|nr:hypothetical protein [Saprospiraceae bacterium]